MFFGSEEQGDGAIEREGARGVAVFVRRGRDEPVAACLERFDRGRRAVVALHGEPFRAAERDTVVGTVGVGSFDDMDILDAEAFAAAQAGGGVVRLVDVFEENSEMAGPLGEDLVDFFPLVLGNIAAEIFGQFLVGGHRCETDWRKEKVTVG